MNKEKTRNIKCNFCNKEFEFSIDLIDPNKEKNICSECFSKETEAAFLKMHTSGKFDIDISKLFSDVNVCLTKDQMNNYFAVSLSEDIVDECFPSFWSQNKTDLKELSKKDLALEAFDQGVYIGLCSILEMISMNKEVINSQRRCKNEN